MELSQCKERLDAWFSDKEPEMLSMLERIVNMDSFTNDAADVNKVGEVVTGWLAEAGFHTAKLPKKPAPGDEQWMALAMSSRRVPILWNADPAWPLLGIWTPSSLRVRRERVLSDSIARRIAPRVPA